MLTQTQQMRAPLGPLPLGQLGRRAEADETRKVHGPRAQTALVPTAEQQGMQVQRLVDDQGADTLGAVDFMGGEAHELDTALHKIDRYFSEGLQRIAVHL